MKVQTTIYFGTDINANNIEVDCITVTCERCGASQDSYGHGPASIRRCLALLRENCPEGENNFYVSDAL